MAATSNVTLQRTAMLNAGTTELLAIGVLVATAVGLVVWAWRSARRTGFKPSQYPLYWLGVPLTRLLWQARVVGRMELPRQGGAVVVCNHRGPVDPAFVALACLQAVRWMVAREYFAVPFFGGVLRVLEAVPTRRGGVDTSAVKETIRSARAGRIVGVFPEGKINMTDELLLPLRSGAAMIALEAGVPIVPCYIDGSPAYQANLIKIFFSRARTTIRVGRPIDTAEYAALENDRQAQDELTRRIGREIAKLAGHDDYDVQLAGRRNRETGGDE